MLPDRTHLPRDIAPGTSVNREEMARMRTPRPSSTTGRSWRLSAGSERRLEQGLSRLLRSDLEAGGITCRLGNYGNRKKI